MKIKSFKISRAFTIIELLITIFIFSTVMIMASSSFVTSYISGRTHSSSSMEANRSLSSVLDIIGQKMANASGKMTYNYVIYYGFRASGNVLTIVLEDNATCVYFRQRSDTIIMAQQDCSLGRPLVNNSAWEIISSPNIKITNANFTFPAKNEWSQYDITADRTAPYLTVTIIGEDTKTKGKATLETTYSIPAYTYNKW